MSDEKKKAVCPCCAKAHVGTFPEMLKRWETITQVVKAPRSTQVILGDTLRLLLQDSNTKVPTVFALLNHVALAEFYYGVLLTDIGDLQLTNEEQSQLETMLSDLWLYGMSLSASLEAARRKSLSTPVPEGTTPEAVFAAEVVAGTTVDEGPDIGDEKLVPDEGGTMHNFLWWNPTAPRGQA